MSLSKNIDFNSFYSFLEKAWQPMWLAHFIYCYLFVDIFSFYFSGSGIFNYSLMHILELDFANIIIAITVFGVFSIYFLTFLNNLLRQVIIEINYRFSISETSKDNYSQVNGYVSRHQLSNDKLVKKFEDTPDYLTNIYITESEKYNLKISKILKLETLTLGVICFSIIEMFFINVKNSNTLGDYLQHFFDNKGIVHFVWIVYIPTLGILFTIYYKLCNLMPNDYFYNPVIYKQIKNIKND